MAAQIYHSAATHLVTDPVLAARNQPDILSMHLEFLRPCERRDSIIAVTTLKAGSVTSTLQLQLSQNGNVKIVALATATNFDKVLGPSVATDWTLHPPPLEKQDFERVAAQQPDEHWIPGQILGEIIPVTRRILVLNSRGGHTVAGVCDAWNRFLGDERMDATYLAMMADIIPSLSDTILRNGELYDGHAFIQKLQKWAEKNPGVPAVVGNSVAEAMQSATFNQTVTMDLEFKRRIPKEGQRWIFTRVASKMLRDGRMDLDITMCNEQMELLCTARQVIVVLEAGRKFQGNKEKSAL